MKVRFSIFSGRQWAKQHIDDQIFSLDRSQSWWYKGGLGQEAKRPGQAEGGPVVERREAKVLAPDIFRDTVERSWGLVCAECGDHTLSIWVEVWLPLRVATQANWYWPGQPGCLNTEGKDKWEAFGAGCRRREKSDLRNLQEWKKLKLRIYWYHLCTHCFLPWWPLSLLFCSNCHRQVLSSCMMNFGEQELCGGAQVTTQARIEIRNQDSWGRAEFLGENWGRLRRVCTSSPSEMNLVSRHEGWCWGIAAQRTECEVWYWWSFLQARGRGIRGRVGIEKGLPGQMYSSSVVPASGQCAFTQGQLQKC